jgi:hypothetical protein
MARVEKKRKPKTHPETALEAMLREYMQALAIQNYSENTISNRTFHLVAFIRWCQERGLMEPVEVTRPVLEQYQRYLFHYRKKNGEPMSFRTQHSRLGGCYGTELQQFLSQQVIFAGRDSYWSLGRVVSSQAGTRASVRRFAPRMLTIRLRL